MLYIYIKLILGDWEILQMNIILSITYPLTPLELKRDQMLHTEKKNKNKNQEDKQKKTRKLHMEKYN